MQNDNSKALVDFVDNLTDMVYVSDFKGDFIFFNTASLRLLGYRKEELIGRNFKEFIHPDDLEEVVEFYKTHLKQLSKETYKEFRIVKKDNSSAWVSQNVKAIIDEKESKVLQYTATVRNIDAHKKNELELRKSQENFRLMNETLTDTYYLYNIAESRYEYISPNCKRVMGADQEFFYSGKKHTDEYVIPEDQHRVRQANKLVNAGAPYDIDYRVLIDGKIQWLNEKSSPIRDEYGKITLNSGVCRVITEQKEKEELIHQQTKSIADSIEYAKSIQQSVLPTDQELKALFPKSFVFYAPKEELSGDFYMAQTINTNDGKVLKSFVVADCTGHGVPGGILSLLCNALIRETFRNPEINSPQQALDHVKSKLVEFFRSDETKGVYDGMDVGFCVYDPVAKRIYFSGANISLLHISHGVLTEYRGDRQHVGYDDSSKPFTGEALNVKTGDLLYMTTDGYTDQFGGPENRKYMRKRFHDLVVELSSYSIEKQRGFLRDEFYEWLDDNQQIDDVTVMAVEIE